MEQQGKAAEPDQQHEYAPQDLLFEGQDQETVEIAPHIERLSVREREQSVVAGVGRSRVTRQVGEGAPASPAAEAERVSTRDDELEAVIYQLAGYYSLAIVTLILTVVAAVIVTLNVGA